MVHVNVKIMISLSRLKFLHLQCITFWTFCFEGCLPLCVELNMGRNLSSLLSENIALLLVWNRFCSVFSRIASRGIRSILPYEFKKMTGGAKAAAIINNVFDESWAVCAGSFVIGINQLKINRKRWEFRETSREAIPGALFLELGTHFVVSHATVSKHLTTAGRLKKLDLWFVNDLTER